MKAILTKTSALALTLALAATGIAAACGSNQGGTVNVDYHQPKPECTLVGDLNGDGKVSITDLSIMLSNQDSTNKVADLNKDGIVNKADLNILLAHFGETCENQTPPPQTGEGSGNGDVCTPEQQNMGGIDTNGVCVVPTPAPAPTPTPTPVPTPAPTETTTVTTPPANLPSWGK